MAFLADLRDLAQGGAELQARADGQLVQHDALDEDVFGERAGAEREIDLFLHLLHAFDREQAHLPVPVPGMGIAVNAPVL